MAPRTAAEIARDIERETWQQHKDSVVGALAGGGLSGWFFSAFGAINPPAAAAILFIGIGCGALSREQGHKERLHNITAGLAAGHANEEDQRTENVQLREKNGDLERTNSGNTATIEGLNRRAEISDELLKKTHERYYGLPMQIKQINNLLTLLTVPEVTAEHIEEVQDALNFQQAEINAAIPNLAEINEPVFLPNKLLYDKASVRAHFEANKIGKICFCPADPLGNDPNACRSTFKMQDLAGECKAADLVLNLKEKIVEAEQALTQARENVTNNLRQRRRPGAMA